MSEPVDLQLLRREYPGGRQLCADPAIWLFDDFATPAEMTALVDAAKDQLQRAEVSGDVGGFVSDGRSGSNCWIAHDHGRFTLKLAQRISQLVGIPLTHAESFQIVHYGPQQQYKPHFDAWDAGTTRGDRNMARGGQRLVTALVYLNHVEDGGATAFPKLALEVRPCKGSLLLFHNCPAGSNLKHPNSLHGGMPVTAGEKWAANLWFRQQDYRRKPVGSS